MARHLTMVDRDRSAELKHRGARQNAITRALKRRPSTICRELKRNGSGDEYLAGQAQQRAESRRRERPILRKMDDSGIKSSVCLRLKQYWSPEQIGGRLKRLASGQRVVSARTIYNWINSRADHKIWRKLLRNCGKRVFRPRRPDRIGALIKDRPRVIEDRSRLGNFEGDTNRFLQYDSANVTQIIKRIRFSE